MYLNNNYIINDPYRRSHLKQHSSGLRGVFFISQPDIEPDRCALNNVHYRYRILDLRVYIRHAPARLRIAANMFVLHAVMQLFACWRGCGSVKALGGWVWGNVGCEAVATHLYARLNFKLNRAATLA